MKTTEEKAQAYDKALEIAKEVIKTYQSINFDSILFYVKADLQEIFPELKDEDSEYTKKTEKQDNSVTLPNAIYRTLKSSNMFDLVNEFANKYSHLIWETLMDNFKNIENYHIGCNDVSDIVLNAIINAYNWLETKISEEEEKSADKVEPKFEVGDVIRCKDLPRDEYTITEVREPTYILDNEKSLSISSADAYWELVEQKSDECIEDDDSIREELISFLKSYDIFLTRKFTIWLEKQRDNCKLSEEEQSQFANAVLTSCATSFINYLNAHKDENKMCVSNGECEDIENAFQNAMWDRLHRYYCKYIYNTEKQGKQKSNNKTAIEVWKDMRLEVYAQASGNRHEPNYSDDSTKMFSLTDIDEIFEKIDEQQGEQTSIDKVVLRESEEETMQELIHNLITLNSDTPSSKEVYRIYGKSMEQAIAWFEKQCQIKRLTFNNDKSFIEDIKDIISDSPLVLQSDKEKMIAWLEKQGSHKTPQTTEQNSLKQPNGYGELTKEAFVSAPTCISENLPHKKPIFNKGEWLVDNYDGTVVQITSIRVSEENVIIYEHTKGSFTDSCENYFHRWTIEDAKDGDILYDGNNALIFRKIAWDGYSFWVHAYCGINDYGVFIRTSSDERWCLGCDCIPATKEQRDSLFAEMHKEGYMWDFEHKKLVGERNIVRKRNSILGRNTQPFNED